MSALTPLPKRHKVIVHLIRHASSNTRSTMTNDPVVGDEGKQQCMNINISNYALGEIQDIISSPLLRALDTARLLFNDVLLNTPAKVILFPELQMGGNSGAFEDTQTVGRLRLYGEDLIDISRIVNPCYETARRSSTEANVKTVMKWLVAQRKRVTDEPLEIAVISHSSVLCYFLKENVSWQKLKWYPCVLSDRGQKLEQFKPGEFALLKQSVTERRLAIAKKKQDEEEAEASLEKERQLAIARKEQEEKEVEEKREEERKLAKARKEQEKQDQEKEREKEMEQVRQDRQLAADLEQLSRDMQNVSNRLKDLAIFEPHTNNEDRKKERDRLREEGNALAVGLAIIRETEREENLERHKEWTQQMFQKHDEKLQRGDEEEQKSEETENKRYDVQFQLDRQQWRAENLTKSAIPQKSTRAEEMSMIYMKLWKERIEQGLLNRDKVYCGKTLSFSTLRCQLPPEGEKPNRLIFDQMTVKPALRQKVDSLRLRNMIHSSEDHVSLGMRDSTGYMIDFGPILSMNAQSSSYIRRVLDEIQISEGKLPAENVLAVKAQSDYPLLPIMVKVRLFGNAGWFRGYLPGPKGMEMFALLYKMPGTNNLPSAPLRKNAKRKADNSEMLDQDYRSFRENVIRLENEDRQAHARLQQPPPEVIDLTGNQDAVKTRLAILQTVREAKRVREEQRRAKQRAYKSLLYNAPLPAEGPSPGSVVIDLTRGDDGLFPYRFGSGSLPPAAKPHPLLKRLFNNIPFLQNWL